METSSSAAISIRRSMEQTLAPLSMRVIWLRSTHNFSASSSCVMPQAFLALCRRFPKPRGSKPCKGVLLSFILCTLPFGSPPFLLGFERAESQKRRCSNRRQQKPHSKTAVCRFEMRLVLNYTYQQFMLTVIRNLYIVCFALDRINPNCGRLDSWLHSETH